MKNYFTVTVSDANGEKHFTLHKRVKHILALILGTGALQEYV